MNPQQQREQMVALGLSLFQRGFVTGGAGNMSVRFPDGHILATPTGSSFGRLEAAELSVVDLQGNQISGKQPSKEVSFHLALYQSKPECNAIVHLHSTFLTALSCLQQLDPENAIRACTPYYVMRIGKLPVIPYSKPGSAELGEALRKLAPSHRAFLLANHGPVVTGSDLIDAVDNTEELEETAKLALLLTGQEVRYLTPSEILALTGGAK